MSNSIPKEVKGESIASRGQFWIQEYNGSGDNWIDTIGLDPRDDFEQALRMARASAQFRARYNARVRLILRRDEVVASGEVVYGKESTVSPALAAGRPLPKDVNQWTPDDVSNAIALGKLPKPERLPSVEESQKAIRKELRTGYGDNPIHCLREIAEDQARCERIGAAMAEVFGITADEEHAHGYITSEGWRLPAGIARVAFRIIEEVC